MDTDRQRYLKRNTALKKERSSWEAHWRDTGEYIRPRSYRYLATDRNRGTKRNQNIINNTATMALRTMAAGMMAGITSPARPWFRLGTKDSEKSNYGAVRTWLDVVEEELRSVFAGSNIYNCLHKVYESLGQFGTAVLHVDEDDKDTLRGYVWPVGQFSLANSDRLQVDSVYREFSMTVAQLVKRFGEDKCSQRVKDMFKEGNTEAWVEVLHVIEPNGAHEPGALGPKGKAWRSCWMEVKGDEQQGCLLDSGFHEFPIMAPRWDVTGEDVYGESPGMEALGDIKALQLLERRKAQAADKIINPPMRGPTSLMNQRVSLLPGDITYVDTVQAGQSFGPAMEINPATITVAEASIREHERRINTNFFADLWLMMAQRDEEGASSQMTAREVTERHEEKMLQLGPVMERLERELFGPLIDRAFGILLRAGRLPPPPPELQGKELEVEYLSIMSVAQKMLGNGSIERFVGFVGNLATLAGPSVMAKLDTDAFIEEYGANLSIKSTLIRSDEETQALRQQQAQAQQQQQATEQALAAAKGAQTLSQADMSGDNALTRLASLPAVAGAQGNLN